MSSGVEVATGFLFEAEANGAPERLANRSTSVLGTAWKLRACLLLRKVSKDLYSRPWEVSRPWKKLN